MGRERTGHGEAPTIKDENEVGDLVHNRVVMRKPEEGAGLGCQVQPGLEERGGPRHVPGAYEWETQQNRIIRGAGWEGRRPAGGAFTASLRRSWSCGGVRPWGWDSERRSLKDGLTNESLDVGGRQEF